MSARDAEFAVLGAGVLGSVIAAHLARAGRDVLLLARGARAQQVTAEGLRIRGLAEFNQPVPVLTEPATLRDARYLVVTTKTYSMEAALMPLRGARIGAAFSFQNGLMKNEQLCIGELNGASSERARAIAAIIDDAGVRSSAVEDIQGLEWAKFASWAALMVLSITVRTETWRYMNDADAALVMARLVREVGALAIASGVNLSDQSMLPVASLCAASETAAAAAIMALGEQMRANAPRHRMSTLQDLQAGRPLEVEETLGFAVRKAAERGVPVPLLASSYALARAIDRIR